MTWVDKERKMINKAVEQLRGKRVLDWAEKHSLIITPTTSGPSQKFLR